MDPYWASLTLVLAVVGAILKYLVWDFFNRPEGLHERFSPGLTEARLFIHERKFLPPMEDIVQAVIDRQNLVPAAPVIQILTDISIDADVRTAVEALTDRIGLDRSYQRAITLCPWVAGNWLVVSSVGVLLFFVCQHSPEQAKPSLVKLLIGALIVFILSGLIILALFGRARNNLVRLIGVNRF